MPCAAPGGQALLRDIEEGTTIEGAANANAKEGATGAAKRCAESEGIEANDEVATGDAENGTEENGSSVKNRAKKSRTAPTVAAHPARKLVFDGAQGGAARAGWCVWRVVLSGAQGSTACNGALRHMLGGVHR